MKENRTQGEADHTSAMHSDHMEFDGCQYKLRPLYFVHIEIEKINFQICETPKMTLLSRREIVLEHFHM